MPHNPLPAIHQAKSSFKMDEFPKLKAERETIRPFSMWEQQTYNTMLDWLTNGTPDDGAEHPPPHEGTHNLDPAELQLAIDTMARFLQKGFAYGPIDIEDWPLKPPHCVGTFLRHQKNTESCRIIMNCSAPPERSINDKNCKDSQKLYHYNMAQPADLARAICEHGLTKLLKMIKADLNDAFKNVPVNPTQWHKQVLKFSSAYFIDNRLLFGDNLSPHRFVFIHEGIQMLFVLPFVNMNARDLHLAIDDSTVIGYAEHNKAGNYHDRYQQVTKQLGLGIKPADPQRIKAFNVSDKGQALGIEFDLPTRTWHVPEMKRNDLSQCLEQVVDMTDVRKIVPATLNGMQQVIGLLQSFAKMSQFGKVLLLVVNAEANYYLKKLAAQNDIPPEQQTKMITMSIYAKSNILAFRAMLIESHNYPLPLENDNEPKLGTLAADIVLYTDASGQPKDWTDKEYSPTCLGIFQPRTLRNNKARATCFVLPHSFLIGWDQYGPVFNNMSLLELLPSLALILTDPHKFRNKTVIVFTDNDSTVTVFRKINAKKLYLAHFLEVYYMTLAALNCKLSFQWKRRRSTRPMIIADDLTHCNFKNCPPATNERKQRLPAPLETALLSTTSYPSHTLHLLRRNTKLYLKNKLPNITFPV